MIKRLLLILGVICLVAAGATAGFIIWEHHRTDSGIPDAIIQKPAFTVFSHDPSDKTWKIQTADAAYDTSQGILKLKFIHNGNTMTLTEQVTPGVFTDIPTYYQALLGKLKEYAEIQTTIGTVALTHPVELKGGQSAVISTQGTLMFAHPDHGLSIGDWQEFFDAMRKV